MPENRSTEIPGLTREDLGPNINAILRRWESDSRKTEDGTAWRFESSGRTYEWWPYRTRVGKDNRVVLSGRVRRVDRDTVSDWVLSYSGVMKRGVAWMQVRAVASLQPGWSDTASTSPESPGTETTSTP